MILCLITGLKCVTLQAGYLNLDRTVLSGRVNTVKRTPYAVFTGTSPKYGKLEHGSSESNTSKSFPRFIEQCFALSLSCSSCPYFRPRSREAVRAKTDFYFEALRTNILLVTSRTEQAVCWSVSTWSLSSPLTAVLVKEAAPVRGRV